MLNPLRKRCDGAPRMVPKIGNTACIVLAKDISAYASKPLFLLRFAVRLLSPSATLICGPKTVVPSFPFLNFKGVTNGDKGLGKRGIKPCHEVFRENNQGIARSRARWSLGGLIYEVRD